MDRPGVIDQRGEAPFRDLDLRVHGGKPLGLREQGGLRAVAFARQSVGEARQVLGPAFVHGVQLAGAVLHPGDHGIEAFARGIEAGLGRAAAAGCGLHAVAQARLGRFDGIAGALDLGRGSRRGFAQCRALRFDARGKLVEFGVEGRGQRLESLPVKGEGTAHRIGALRNGFGRLVELAAALLQHGAEALESVARLGEPRIDESDLAAQTFGQSGHLPVDRRVDRRQAVANPRNAAGLGAYVAKGPQQKENREHESGGNGCRDDQCGPAPRAQRSGGQGGKQDGADADQRQQRQRDADSQKRAMTLVLIELGSVGFVAQALGCGGIIGSAQHDVVGADWFILWLGRAFGFLDERDALDDIGHGGLS